MKNKKNAEINLNENLHKKEKILLNSIVETYIETKYFSHWDLSRAMNDLGIKFDDGKLSPFHEELIFLKVKVEQIFDKFDIKLFPFAGTLLGLVRDNGFIPHDDDSDYAASFKLIEENFDEIKTFLENYKIIIKKQFYDKTGYYIYHIKSSKKIKFMVGKHLFMPPVVMDIFPTASFDDEEEFHDFYKNFLISMISSASDNWNDKYLRNILDTNYRIFKMDYENSGKETSKFKLTYDYFDEIRKTKIENPNLWKERYFKSWEKVNNGSQTNVMIVSLGNYYQIPIKEYEEKKIMSNLGEISYLSTPEDEKRLELKYGKDWREPAKVPVVHSLLKVHYKK